jgi:hypothetical protein
MHYENVRSNLYMYNWRTLHLLIFMKITLELLKNKMIENFFLVLFANPSQMTNATNSQF